MSLITERVTSVQMFGPLSAGTTASAATGTIIDLQAYNADSLFVVTTVGNTTSTGGVSVTLQAGATTAAFAALCTPGTTVAVTSATTVSSRTLQIDAKNISHRYVRLLSNTTSAVVWGSVGIPYDSKKNAISASSDVAQTFSVVGPTTTV